MPTICTSPKAIGTAHNTKAAEDDALSTYFLKVAAMTHEPTKISVRFQSHPTNETWPISITFVSENGS